MNRLLTLILMGLAGLLVSCGAAVSSSTQPGTNDVYSLFVTPTQLTLNAGDWSSISATVELSYENGAPKPVSPQPTIQFYSSDNRVSVSPAGEVCAGQWNTEYQVCTPTVSTTGQLDLPTGYVTITVYNASHNVTGSTLVSVHPRASNITLSVPASNLFVGVPITQPLLGQVSSNIPLGAYPTTTNCVSQNNYFAAVSTVNGKQVTTLASNNYVQYVAAPVDASGTAIPTCTAANPAQGCIFPTDYVWTSDNPSVASVSASGVVVAGNPGVANITATLNGTKSAPLAFVSCPPSAIVVATSADTGIGLPPVLPSCTVSPIPADCYTYSTGDLTLSKGGQEYLSATMVDTNGIPLTKSTLNYITSNPLTGSFTTAQPLTSTLTANTSGRFSMMAACEPPSCNNAVADFIVPSLPGTTGATTGKSLGFGYPIYSNVIGVTVQGISPSTVLVTGSKLADGITAAHQLLAYDSESLLVTEAIALPNTPNSMVVAPNGATAYLGSSAGLMVANLTTYQTTPANFAIVGGSSTDVITGTVLGVSPDSRYVVVSDVLSAAPNSYVFLIDTTGTKTATRYTIPGSIDAVTFAADDSYYWIGGSSGVYVFTSDTFVPISSVTPTDAVLSNVKALAWMPDGQSYFASGTQLVNYSTCDSQNPNSGLAGTPINLDTTVIDGVPHAVGLSAGSCPGTLSPNCWYDYSVNITPPVGLQTVAQLSNLVPGGKSDVCLSTVTVSPPVTTASTLLSTTPSQVTFSPTLQQEFVTGVSSTGATAEPFIHGYSLAIPATSTVPATAAAEFTLSATNSIIPLSGGVLNDGRKLYIGTNDSNGPLLHRFDLATGTGTPGTRAEDLPPVSVAVVPDFVAVVPK